MAEGTLALLGYVSVHSAGREGQVEVFDGVKLTVSEAVMAVCDSKEPTPCGCKLKRADGSVALVQDPKICVVGAGDTLLVSKLHTGG